jgi:uncharacterized membrane protein (GlpM family)
MSGSIPLLPQYAFVAWYLVKKHRDSFTFYLLYVYDSRWFVVGMLCQQSDLVQHFLARVELSLCLTKHYALNTYLLLK